MKLTPQRILIVYAHRGPNDKMRLAIRNHLHVLEESEIKHNIVYYNAYEHTPSHNFLVEQNSPLISDQYSRFTFDLVIIHNTFLCLRWTDEYFYNWKKHFSWIAELDCLKFAIPQDEGDHAELLDEWLFEWGISVIFSVHYKFANSPLYSLNRSHVKFYSCLPGYISDKDKSAFENKYVPISERSKDIVYRATHLPYWFGTAGQLKHQIADVFKNECIQKGLISDISTSFNDLILGTEWLDFLASSKFVIGCEGGSSIVDWRGEIRHKIKALLIKQPNLSYSEVSAQLDDGWDSYKFFTITPRHFEAVITKTCQILVEGEYKGILKPDIHYIPLKRDFSNIGEVLEKVRNTSYAQGLVDRAYEDIYLSGKYSYQAFANLIEQAIMDQEQEKKRRSKRDAPLELMPDQKNVVEVLERQLVSQRHEKALLEAKLMAANKEAVSFTSFIKRLLQDKRALIIIGTVLGILMLLNALVTFLSVWLIFYLNH